MAEIYKSYLEANGGLPNIQNITSMRVRGRIITEEREELPFTLYRKRPNLLRVSIEYQNYSADTIYNGIRGWIALESTQGQSITELTGIALQQLIEDSEIDGPFFRLGRKLENLDLIGTTLLNGEACFEIMVNHEDSTFEKIWLSQDNFQEIKLQRRSRTDHAEVETIQFRDHLQVGRIWIPGIIQYYTGDRLTRTAYIDDAKMNVGIYNYFFEPRD